MKIENIHAGSFKRLIGGTIALWPEHERFLNKSFEAHSAQDVANLTRLADDIDSLIGDDLPRFVRGYRWMCEAFIEEEIYFRRHSKYQCTSFEDANRKVYSNAGTMALYMDGLLLSQLLWSPHCKSYMYYSLNFLSRLPLKYRLLEIGCGHGLLLANAARDPRSAEVCGLDVSAESLRHARETMEHFGCGAKVDFIQADIDDNIPTNSFDGLVLSELLEHLEDPAEVLVRLKSQIKPGGLVYLNIPINSPAPDHIYLWRTIEEVAHFVVDCGYEIVDTAQVPMTGYSLERAISLEASINCLVTAAKQRQQ